MKNRVVVTGLGVCAPNAIGLKAFDEALSKAVSGIRFHQILKELNFSCLIAGKPNIEAIDINQYFTKVQQKGLQATGLLYGMIAAKDAWKDAQLHPTKTEVVDWNSGVVFGTGILGVDKFRDSILKIDEGQTRRLGSTSVIQTMASGVAAYISGNLGLGNQVTANSSACATGTEALIMGYERIKSGKTKRMLVGSTSDSGPYVWGGFDAMRILPSQYNNNPSKASRPMSATAAGFVPGSGAGALVLESLESATKRGATIYAEVLGGAINSGGQRQQGSMTAPNNKGVQRCIQQAIKEAAIEPKQLDAINGHLTATKKDATEIQNWKEALGVNKEEFPLINSFKGLLGHCLAASGSIECVGTVLQLAHQKIYGNVNAEDVHLTIEETIGKSAVVQQTKETSLEYLAKASFGFGDVNACVIFKRYVD